MFHPDPETLAEALALMKHCGYVTVDVDPIDASKVNVRAAPRLIQMIQECGITLADIGYNTT